MAPDDPLASLLLVDHNDDSSRNIVAHFSRHNYDIEWVEDAEKAFNRLDSRSYDALVTVFHGPHLNGVRIMRVALNRNPNTVVIFITDPAHLERSVEVMWSGAYDVQVRPVYPRLLEASLRRGLARQLLLYEHHELKRRLDQRFGFGSLQGKSRRIVQVFDKARGLASTDAPIHITGEEGVGKSLLALTIHNNSRRRDAPFVRMNASACSANHVVSEVLGRVVDAVPDAPDARAGCLELADSGTLYISEVHTLPHEMQHRLEQFLRTHRIIRVGAEKPIHLDVRLITSSIMPFDQIVNTGALLPELAQQLKTSVIDIPALCVRSEDIGPLAVSFLEQATQASGKNIDGFTKSAMDMLCQYTWPGSVRELRNTIESMSLSARNGHPIDVTDIPVQVREVVSGTVSSDISIPQGIQMREVERIVIAETLKACGYNKETCAKILGIGLRTLYRKVKDYELR